MGLLELDWNSAVGFVEFSLQASFICVVLVAITGMMDAVGILPRFSNVTPFRR